MEEIRVQSKMVLQQRVQEFEVAGNRRWLHPKVLEKWNVGLLLVKLLVSKELCTSRFIGARGQWLVSN